MSPTKRELEEAQKRYDQKKKSIQKRAKHSIFIAIPSDVKLKMKYEREADQFRMTEREAVKLEKWRRKNKKT